MPALNDTYTVPLQSIHLGWGEIRHTDSRPKISRETYIPIPSTDAYGIGINRGDTFNCSTADGKFSGVLRASGSQSRAMYAKQFHTDGNLRQLANWLIDICNAKVGDLITVTWLSENDVELSHTAI
jgi:hypothetical protein